jgi:hypothetical protein
MTPFYSPAYVGISIFQRDSRNCKQQLCLEACGNLGTYLVYR